MGVISLLSCGIMLCGLVKLDAMVLFSIRLHKGTQADLACRQADSPHNCLQPQPSVFAKIVHSRLLTWSLTPLLTTCLSQNADDLAC